MTDTERIKRLGMVVEALLNEVAELKRRVRECERRLDNPGPVFDDAGYGQVFVTPTSAERPHKDNGATLLPTERKA